MANDTHYTDAFTRIDLVNGVIRIELGFLQPARAEGQSPEVASAGTLIMSVEGFVRSAATMQQFLEQLTAKGVLRREPGAGGTAQGKQTGRPGAAKASP